jgi:hypothetical protein
MFNPELQRVRQFRSDYARDVRPPGYSGSTHIAIVILVGMSVIAAAVCLASLDWRPAHLWIVPLTLLIANAVEYAAHRGPMHHRVSRLTALHTRHSGRHHRYFTAGQMHFESPDDFHAVLFPPVLLVFFGGVTVALGCMAALFLPRAAAALFVATGVGYYLVYEVLHFLYHVPPQSRGGNLPGVRWLARLHKLHHHHAYMQTHNFNLVFPLCDWIAGTLHNPDTTTHAKSPQRAD